jgi:uncharacterized protein YkwD
MALVTRRLLTHCRSLALLLPIVFVSVPPSWVEPKAEGLAGAQAQRTHTSLVDLANVERTRAGLTALRANTKLMLAAQTQAEQSATIGRLSHVLPEARYPRPQDRLDASGYQWRAYGENIASGQRDASSVTEAWMQSPDHRKNLLSTTYTEVGTGYAVDRAGRPYYVQVFGRPL